ncbi:hypothetical protein DJ568_14420 [Mucilaginibacter hurinus]|uniref:Uncharacterized protein n=1 Tax=Mucilaginibacter hurinus TaxID=2201324 RepID=A0A367GKR1_9SPHI|nr:hypothetical protein DJ568_14420 [Mucilaginibacter hurinus]
MLFTAATTSLITKRAITANNASIKSNSKPLTGNSSDVTDVKVLTITSPISIRTANDVLIFSNLVTRKPNPQNSNRESKLDKSSASIFFRVNYCESLFLQVSG